MVELSQTPVDKSESLVGVVNHDIVWLHISVHDALAVAVVQGLQYLVNVESDVQVREALVQSPEVDVTCVNVLHDQGRRLGHWVSDHVDEVDDVDSSSEGLQDLDFSSDLGLLDWLQNLDDDSFVVQSVDALVYLGVLASSDLLYDLVIFLRSKFSKIWLGHKISLFGKAVLSAALEMRRRD